MAIYNGSNKVNPSGMSKVFVGDKLVWTKAKDPYIFNNGDIPAVTGGWNNTYPYYITITDTILFYFYATYYKDRTNTVTTKNEIDTTGYTKICYNTTSVPQDCTVQATGGQITTGGISKFDISGTTKISITFTVPGGVSGVFSVSQIWLE